MSMYIQAAAHISIQEPLSEAWLRNPIRYTERLVRSIEPDFKEFINSTESRRKGKILKRALATSLSVVRKTGIDQPDAIISGTGLGCIENTEKFLSAMVRDGEMYLHPTYFMQSTHNTISSQIALHLKCNKYNNTYVQRGISFESSLLDAYLQFQTGKIKHALVGGYDEMTPDYFKMLDKINYWKKGKVNESIMRQSNTAGSFAGETSVSFMLEDIKKEHSLCEVKSVDIFFKPNMARLQAAIKEMLAKHQLDLKDIDVVLTGINGDKDDYAVYRRMQESIFPGKPMAWYKHLFGESFTASGLGMYVAATLIKENTLPKALLYNNIPAPEAIKNILIFNHFQNKDHSLILLSSC